MGRVSAPWFLIPVLLSSVGHGISAGSPEPSPKASPPASPRINYLLISIESLRADRLSSYGGSGIDTPAISALAQGGLRFDRAYASSVSTAPSAASVLTGLYPLHHGLRGDLGGRIRKGVPSLATVLAKAGYRTGGVVGSFHVDSDHSFDPGFQEFDDRLPGLGALTAGQAKTRPAEEVVKSGLAFLDADRTHRPFFLWLDFYDLHYRLVRRVEPPGVQTQKADPQAYARDLVNVDAQIRVFIAGLRERKLYDTTDIILVGSHGEGFDDHGETGHGIYLYETTARVPFLYQPAPARFRGPGRKAVTGIISTPVSLVDLAPTVYDLAGVVAPKGLDGVSLRPAILGGTLAPTKPRRVFVEAMQPFLAYGWSPLFAVIEGSRKIVQGQRLEAFDLSGDPLEAKPIEPLPEWAEELRSFGQPLGRPDDLPQAEKTKILEGAAALQFPWRDAPVCIEKNVFPDPRDKVELNDPLFRARAAYDQGLLGTASTLSGQVLEKDPGNFTALEMVAFMQLRGGATVMLKDTLEVLQCAYPLRGAAYHIYGHQMETVKDYGAGARALEVFRMIEPTNEEPYYDLACVYAKQGKKDLAFQNLSKAMKFGADDSSYMKKDPRLEAIRQDSRFQKLVGPVNPAAP